MQAFIALQIVIKEGISHDGYPGIVAAHWNDLYIYKYIFMEKIVERQ